MYNACKITQTEPNLIGILLHTRMLDILSIVMIHKQQVTNFKYKIKSVFFNLWKMLF